MAAGRPGAAVGARPLVDREVTAPGRTTARRPRRPIDVPEDKHLHCTKPNDRTLRQVEPAFQPVQRPPDSASP